MSDNRTAQNSTDTGSDSGNGRLAGVRQGAAEAYQSTRERTSAAYQAARERAGSAYEGAREKARTASRRTSERIEANPMTAVVGGLAIGLVAGAVLPRTKREAALLGPAGRRIHDTAREAARAAKEAGKQQIGELGLSRDAVQRRVGEFAERAASAVKSSAGAAAGAARSGNG